jgi:GTP cyclohydrolase I
VTDDDARRPKRGRTAAAFDASRVDLEKAEGAVRALLESLGVRVEADPELAATPRLVAEAWSSELLAGYRMDPAAILADAVATSSSDVVAVRDIAVTVMCPHHLLPAPGVVHVAYAPSGRLVGLGALARLVECFARRLTLQETLVQNVADALIEHLGAQGAGCAALLSPTCLTARGARCHAARATSLAARGSMQPGEPLHAVLTALLAHGPSPSAT